MSTRKYLEFSDQPLCIGDLPGTTVRCPNEARLASITGERAAHSWHLKTACFEHSYLLDDDRFMIVVRTAPTPEGGHASNSARPRPNCARVEAPRHRRYP